MTITTPWLVLRDFLEAQHNDNLFICASVINHLLGANGPIPVSGRFKIEISTEEIPGSRRIKLRWGPEARQYHRWRDIWFRRSTSDQPVREVTEWLQRKLKSETPEAIWIRIKK